MSATLTRHRYLEYAEADIHVDSEQGWLRGVKLIGRKSRNGRNYTERALRNAVGKYAGKKVYLNHPRKSEMDDDRPIEKWIGVIRNPRYESGGVYADVQLRTKSPLYPEVIEIAEQFHACCGMSHVAAGQSRFEDGDEVVDEIEEIYSVDLVSDPAATASLYESTARYDLAGAGGSLADRCASVLATLTRLAVERPESGIDEATLEQAAENVGLAKSIELGDARALGAAFESYRESSTSPEDELSPLGYQFVYGKRERSPEDLRRFANRLR